MSDTHRRRIDRALAPDFTRDLGEVDLDELRDRRGMCSELELELSYYRRMLHGRMDLLAFEMRRRAGEEEQSLIDALPRILAEGAYSAPPGLPGRAIPVAVPETASGDRRAVDRALGDDFLIRLPSMSDDDLRETQALLSENEVEISRQRHEVHGVIDLLQAELARRYGEDIARSAGPAPQG